LIAACFMILFGVPLASAQTAEQIAALTAQVRSVGAKGANHAAAQTAAAALQKLPASQLPRVLAGMKGAGPLSENWLRGIVESIATRNAAQLPTAELEKFLSDTQQAPRARRLAFELLVRADAAAEKRLLRGLLNDTSLELRRDAVQLVTDEAAAFEKDKNIASALKSYATAFAHARDVDQVQSLGKKLKELEQPVDMPTRLGFITKWKLIGPFDNVNDVGWNFAYEPETKLDYAAEYKGQKGSVKWIDHTTTDEFGIVDLTKALDKHKGAVTYAATEFVADQARPVQLRLGCINAHKVWLNGELLGTNHVYHAGIDIDQYLFHAQVKPGKNTILIKVCQNEQTEGWAQRWQFQLRVCDELGGAILSQDREVPKTAAN
jgi:hypothetical protein